MSSIVTTVVPCAGTNRRSGQGRVKNGVFRSPTADRLIFVLIEQFVVDVSNLYLT